jgi:hypothetical protein
MTPERFRKELNKLSAKRKKGHWRDGRELRAILESEQAAPEEKFQAQVDLAYLTGVLVRERAEGEAQAL